MTLPHTLEARLEALEIKASFTEDLLDKLDEVIIRQQRTIDALIDEVRTLRELSARTPDGAAPRNLRDDLPPHY